MSETEMMTSAVSRAHEKGFANGIEAAAKEIKAHQLALRSANGESETWVWPAANSLDELVERLRALKPPEQT